MRVANALDRAVAAAGLPCQALLDSVAVRIDRYRSFQPDALVRRGQPLPGDALEAPDPIVVVEVLSPSNAMQDLRDKLVGYFQIPSVAHYLIVDPDDRLVIHHARGSDAIATRIVRAGSSLKLDPPGLEMAVAELFPPSSSQVAPSQQVHWPQPIDELADGDGSPLRRQRSLKPLLTRPGSSPQRAGAGAASGRPRSSAR